MAVLGRPLFASSERVDLPDLLSIDSYTIGDFKYLIQSMVGDQKPYVLKGFEVINPAASIGAQTVSIKISDSVVYFPTSAAGPFYYGLPDGSESSAPLIPELRKNATNFVYLTFTTFDTAQDNRAFWDPDKNGGQGGEFSQNVNTESVISVQVGVSVSSFPDGTIPVCKVVVGPSAISSIEDARDLLFRLGVGGQQPDAFNRYNFRPLPSANFERDEPATKMDSPLDPNPFQGGDKNIQSLKEWMDVTMTKLLEISGTHYWYQDTKTYSLVNIFLDAMASTFKSKGKWIHSSTTPGQTQWTEDLQFKRTMDPRDVLIRANTIQLANEQVAYFAQVRDANINTLNYTVNWTNSTNFVNGQVGAFENLQKGDWVKKKKDDNYFYLRVEEFYANASLGGGPTTPGLAQSIRLGGNYAGTTETEYGLYTKGVYSTTDIGITDRNDPALTTAGGDLLWLADRSDTIMSIFSVVSHVLSCAITQADGHSAKVTATAHGLVNGDRVKITGSSNGYNGIYSVTVLDVNNFTIETTATGDESVTGGYATVTTQARTNGYFMQLESANHGFEDDEFITISGTGMGYDSATPYQIKVRSATTFNIPISVGGSPASTGTATLARIIVRTEFGMAKLVPGESISIGEAETANIRAFIGMGSEADTHPTYTANITNVLSGQDDYNSDVADNLTQRVANLTSMMADKAQDKTIRMLASGYERVVNTTSGGNQDVSFVALLGGSPRLDVAMPRSFSSGHVVLSGSLQLAANQVAYFTINRNANFTVASLAALTVASIESVPIDENVFVFAYRLSGTDVWLWDGCRLSAGISANLTNLELQRITKQNKNAKLNGGGIWGWNLGTTTLTWSAAAHVQIPGLADSANTITSGSVVLPNADSVAYVAVNRQGAGGSNTVVVASISALTDPALTDDLVVIARRDGNDVIVGTGSFRLINGQSQRLDGSISQENKTLIGSNVDDNTADPAYSARGQSPGSPLRTLANSEGALDAIANIDIEIDKFFGQLQLRAHPTAHKRVKITGADRIMRDNTQLAQEIKSLLIKFDGAEIDFSTGSVYAADGTTSLGVDFTPATIASGQWHWYSVTLVPSNATADNRLTAQLVIISATGDDASATLAPRAAFAKGKKLGQVVVQESAGTIADLTQTNCLQLGVGSGEGEGTGLKNYVKNPDNDYALVDWSAVGADISISKTTASGEILSGPGSIKITGVGATNAEYVQAKCDPIDYTDMGKRIYISFYYKTDVTYANDTLTVNLYNENGAVVTQVGTIKNSSTVNLFQATYALPDDPVNVHYHLRFVPNGTFDGEVIMDEVFLGPRIAVTAETQTLVGNKYLEGNFLPAVADEYTLGSNALPWNHLFTGWEGITLGDDTGTQEYIKTYMAAIGKGHAVVKAHIETNVNSLILENVNSAQSLIELSSAGIFAIGDYGINTDIFLNVQQTIDWSIPSIGLQVGMNLSTIMSGTGDNVQLKIVPNLSSAASTVAGIRVDNSINGVSVDTQYGIYISSLTSGATNNYGLYSNISAGTGKWFLYDQGGATSYFQGAVGFGNNNQTDLAIARAVFGTSSSTTAIDGINFGGDVNLYRSAANTLQTDDTLVVGGLTINGDLFPGSDNVYHLGSPAARWANIYAGTGGIWSYGDSNHYIFLRSSLSSADLAWNAGSLTVGGGTSPAMVMDASGHITFGSTSPLASTVLQMDSGSTSYLSGSTQRGIYLKVAYSATTLATGLTVEANISAGTTLTEFRGISINDSQLWAGATLGSQIGVYISNLANGTSNYGLFSDLAAGTNKWFLYGNSTAASLLNGDLTTNAARYVKYGTTKTGAATVAATDYIVPVDSTTCGLPGSTASGTDQVAGQYGIDSGIICVAQTFLATASGQVTDVQFMLEKFSSPTGATLVAEIRAVNGSNVPTTILATSSTSVAATAIPVSKASVSFSFTSGPTLTAGTTYAVTVRVGTGTVSGGQVVVYGTNPGTYASGQTYFSFNGTSFSTTTAPDIWFNVNVKNSADISLPAVASSNKGRVIYVKDVGGVSNQTGKAITVLPAGSDTIDGDANFVIDQPYQSITLVSNGVNGWAII